MEDLLGADGRAAELINQAMTLIMTYAPKVVLAIITLVVGLWLINRFVGVLDNKLGKKDPTLNKFLCGLIGAILLHLATRGRHPRGAFPAVALVRTAVPLAATALASLLAAVMFGLATEAWDGFISNEALRESM